MTFVSKIEAHPTNTQDAAYKPGAVVAAKIDGADVRLVRSIDAEWIDASRTGGRHFYAENEVTDVRPLVVLDVEQIVSACDEGKGRWGYVVDALRHEAKDYDRTLSAIADQIEAQTKPPRIPEPGLWGVVEAGVKQHDVRLNWVRLAGGIYRPSDSDEYDRQWDDLIDPTLIREGINA